MTNDNRGHILVVDDDQGALEALGDILEHAGYAVVRAENGVQALEALHSAPRPNLIILDLLMPVMDGWEFRTRQKQDPDPALAAVPVLAVSALDATIDAAMIMRKPIDIAALLRNVQRYC